MTGGRFGSTTTAFRFGIRRDGWTCARSGPEDRSSRSDATRRVAGLLLLQLNPESENLWAIPIHLLAANGPRASPIHRSTATAGASGVGSARAHRSAPPPPGSHLPRLTAGLVRCLGPWYAPSPRPRSNRRESDTGQVRGSPRRGRTNLELHLSSLDGFATDRAGLRVMPDARRPDACSRTLEARWKAVIRLHV
jgi:hypothetical protein